MNSLRNIQSIAVIDDEEDALEASIYDVEAMGKTAYPLKQRYSTPQDVLAEIHGKADAVLCDHRLGHGGIATFDGATLAAFLYQNKIPSVLMTQFYEIDRDVSIRRWRKSIPSLVSKKDINSDRLSELFAACTDELSGVVASGRRPYPSLFEILSRNTESGEDVVDITLPAWNAKQALRIPLSLFTQIRNDLVIPGLWLISDVNIGAEKDEDLFFDNIRIAPPPDKDDGLS